MALDPDRLKARYAMLLGYAGALVVPVLLLLALLLPDLAAVLRRVSVIYAAAILAFLGGVQWGVAMGSEQARSGLRRLVVSMVPPLWSVMALSLPVRICTVLLIVGLVALLAYEWLERRGADYPPWFLSLRLQLTAALTVGLAATLLL